MLMSWLVALVSVMAVQEDVFGVHINKDVRIIGGSNADIKDYPYQLGISYEGEFGCGAALISPKWAATAAHCLHRLDITKITIKSNSTIINEGVTTSLTKAIVHPNYTFAVGDFDIALLELSTPLYCTYCKPIKLAHDTPKPGDILTLTGWGKINEWDIGTGSRILQMVQVPTVNRDVCEKFYMQLDPPSPLTENMFCAGWKQGKKDSCVGDSGGPAVAGGVLSGIISAGVGCARPESPGIYTDISKLSKWIQEHTDIVP